MKNKIYICFSIFILLNCFTKLSAQCPTLVFGSPIVNNATCNNTNATGSITAKLTSGDPIKWELLDYGTLAVIQTFNSTAQTFTFAGVAAGQYKVRVTDGCNFVLTQDQTVGFYPSISAANFKFFAGQTKEYVDVCGNEKVRVFVSYGDTNTGNGIVYPLTITANVHMPNGSTQTVVKNIASAGTNNLTVDNTGQIQLNFIDLPLVEQSNYTYVISITDGCNNTKTNSGYNLDTHKIAYAAASLGPTACGNVFPFMVYADNFQLSGTVSATILSYNGSSTTSPAGTTITLNQNFPNSTTPNASCCYQVYEIFHFQGSFGNQPTGIYDIKITDSCNRTYTFQYNHNPQLNYLLSAQSVANCGAGSNDNVAINQSQSVAGDTGGSYRYMKFQNAKITAAPVGSGLALPLDVSNYIVPGSTQLIIPGSVFPVQGTYTIEVTNECGYVQSTNVTIGQYLPNYNAIVQTGCNVFSLNMNFSNIKGGLYYPATNNVNQHQFLLQFYNPITSKWEHPTTGSYLPTVPSYIVDSGNGLVLQNNFVNGPWAKSGKYRIVDIYMVDSSVYPPIGCMVVAKEFDVNFNITFTHNVIQCPDGTFTMLASASGGNGNFTFKLYDSTHTNLIQSNTTGVFTNLAVGDYLLDITDTCPNSLLNLPISIPGTAALLAIQVTGDPCTTGSQVTLSVPKLGGVTYKWYKTSAPGTVLSTNNDYTFTANPPTTSTSYSVQMIFAPNPLNCINQTLTYVVPTCVCYNDPSTSGPGTQTSHGITLLKRAGSTEPNNWPMVRKSAHTVLESNTKGFVVTRMTSDPAQSTATNYIGKILNPQDGMMVYDMYSKCLKLYSDGSWKCFEKPACP